MKTGENWQQKHYSQETRPRESMIRRTVDPRKLLPRSVALSFRSFFVLAAAVLAAPMPSLLAQPNPAQPSPATLHTNPLNLDPTVRDGFQHFYILDYEGAISRFESVLAAHPDDPMASGYVLMATVFRELYRQDLLDTTYYAHDSFLT